MSAIDAAIDRAEHRLYEAEDRMIWYRRMLKGATDFDACLLSFYDRHLEAVRSQIEGFDRIKATFRQNFSLEYGL